ncbi:hypothetical protein DRQ18_01500 [bacterium]|nr:MAG: hypothetical protein DRQ18_01500 [bacterium]
MKKVVEDVVLPEIAGILGHEINGVLTSLLLTTDLAEEEGLFIAKGLRKCVEHLQRVSNDLSELAERRELNLKEVECKKFFNEIFGFAPECSRKLKVDREKMRWALSTLKESVKEGEVSFSISSKEVIVNISGEETPDLHPFYFRERILSNPYLLAYAARKIIERHGGKVENGLKDIRVILPFADEEPS